MNHFLALLPDHATRDRLAAVQDRLRAWELPATWTHPDDLHLTLLFLGDLPEDEGGLIAAAAGDLAAAVRPPALRLAGLGASGTARGQVPRAVFAAVEDPAGACAALHRDFAAMLDCEERRPFTPHLTLARPLPDPQARERPLFRDWPHLLEANGLADWGLCTLAEVALCRSHHGRTPRYQTLASWPVLAT